MLNRDRIEMQWQLLNDRHAEYSVREHRKHSASTLLVEVAEGQAANPKYLDAKAYYEQLIRLTDEQLSEEARVLAERLDAEYEAKQFFNQPGALATDQTYDFWSRAELWTLAEAAALINARDPAVVTEDRIANERAQSKAGTILKQTLDLLTRARKSGTLSYSNSPKRLIDWTQLKHINMPEKLVELSLARSETPFTASNEIQTLRTKLASFETAPEKAEAVEGAQKKDTSLGLRERESLLKLVLGMAIKGYGYNPHATRSSEITDIANDMAGAGLPMEADTVRKYINEAKVQFSGELSRTD